MKTTTVAPERLPRGTAPARPIVPMPLWERDRLFQEPTYQDGQPYAGDDDLEDDGDG